MDEENVERLSAGEVCSIDMAKNIVVDIYDNAVNNGQYMPDYKDVKTYDPTKDALNNANIYKLCEITDTNETSAAPLCVFEKNAGFGFTKKKSGGSKSYDLCTTSECPTGFTIDPSNENNCLKPKIKNTDVLATVVENRWFDWFIIPDYHLGNKYARVDNVNYAPCKKGSIPSYETDPVDGLKKTFSSSSKDELNKCVEKTKYFGGKYFNSETYCPLAWVFRAGATKKDLKKIYTNLINQLDETELGNEYLDMLKKRVEDIIHNEIYTPVLKYGFDDYVGNSQTDEARAACNMLDNNDATIKTEAINICKTIKELGKEMYIEKLMRENSEDESTAKKKYKRAIQACNTLFCKDDNAEQICFPEVEKKNFDKETVVEPEKPDVIDPTVKTAEMNSKFLNVLKFIVIGFFCIIALLIVFPLLRKFGALLNNIRKNVFARVTVTEQEERV